MNSHIRGAKHDETALCWHDPCHVTRVPVRPGKIVTDHQTFEAHGHTRPPCLLCGIAG